MKRTIVVALIISLATCCYAQEKKSSIEGAWKTVQVQGVSKDSLGNTITTNNNLEFSAMWSGKNFAFIGKWKSDTVLIAFYGGGTFTLTGKHYDENIMYNFNKATVGTKMKFILELRNDTLVQTGPLYENWDLPDHYSIMKYLRIK